MITKVDHPKRGLLIETSMSIDRIFNFLAKIQSEEDQCFHTLAHNLENLWHNRYGHLSFEGLKALKQKQMVYGLPELVCSN